ncbi:MAG: DUF4280 domain-containing protein, partial [Lachnospiraceae bacterium]|nr:DUF4280 domain-containing protein [Lachnospiraceae bacterium]
EYVLRGAVLSCTHGNKCSRLDMCRDHGIYSQGNAVMTCNDYITDENIFNFGLCGNSEYQPMYSETAPPPAKTGKDKDGELRHICFPILLEKWGYGLGDYRFDNSYGSYVLNPDASSKCLTKMQHGDEQGEEYEKALMTRDNLICLYSGVITIEENPEEELKIGDEEIGAEQFQFTLEQLIACGWKKATEDDLRKLNDAMDRFDVTSQESAYMMLATMLSESTYCTKKLEGAETFTNEQWKQYKEGLKKKGIRVGEYEWWERGAGYIQLTGKIIQQEFLSAMEDEFSGRNTAEYIGNTYPIEASVYFWGIVPKTGEGNLNAYVMKYGASEGIFLITQYFTNSFVSGINSALESIRKGEAYSIDIKSNLLTVNGKSYVLPNGWEDRAEIWENIYEQMQKIE